MKRSHVLLSLIFVAGTLSLSAQNRNTITEEDPSIAGQFEELERKSTNYNSQGKRYEVIRLIELNKLKKNIFDTISTANQTIKNLSATIENDKSEISTLNSQLQETSKNLKTITAEKDSISFFGAMISKGTYNFILWSIIFGLLLLLLLFVYKFRNSNFLTNQAKTALADVEKEFEQHRRRALEREQKISRQLQDELNKQKNK